jgi:hypothetical protein
MGRGGDRVSARVLDPAAMTANEWPAGSATLRAYADAFAQRGSSALVANVRTELHILCDGDVALPVTVNDTEYDNSYVCSPYNAYAQYSRAEMYLLPSRVLRAALGAVADLAGRVVRAGGVNRIVQVNNWLLSTNLYPRAWAPDLAGVTRTVVRDYPAHFICFRSLNEWANPELCAAFVRAGYRLVASRQVYVYDRLAETWRGRGNARHDLRLLRASPYRMVPHAELGEADYERMAELYDILYRRKYPIYNPAFTTQYIRLCHQAGVMRFAALRGPDGVLDGVLGLFTVDGTTTAPIVGYDTSRDRRLGLYRLLMTLVFETALAEGWKVNLSSGAAQFKRLRGGRPVIEYSAIYDRHLAAHRRLALGALSAPVNGIGVPLLRRLEL